MIRIFQIGCSSTHFIFFLIIRPWFLSDLPYWLSAQYRLHLFFEWTHYLWTNGRLLCPFQLRNWPSKQSIGRISAERNYVHYDGSPVMHSFLWVSGLLSSWVYFRSAEIRPISGQRWPFSLLARWIRSRQLLHFHNTRKLWGLFYSIAHSCQSRV